MKATTLLALLLTGTALLYLSCSQEPVASFTYTGANVAAPDTVTFKSTATDAASYYWDFGDNTFSSVANPVHVYTAGGTYTVLLLASNKNKNSQATQTVKVLQPTGGSQYQCSGQAGNNSYFPLAVGNTWIYSYFSIPQGKHDTYTVTDTTVINHQTYYHVHCLQAVIQDTTDRYFRTDSANNVLERVNGADNLFLPGKPVNNQDLGTSYDFDGYELHERYVYTKAAINVGNCQYTNCLMIEDDNGSTEYFVKGLGCVQSVFYTMEVATLH